MATQPLHPSSSLPSSPSPPSSPSSPSSSSTLNQSLQQEIASTVGTLLKRSYWDSLTKSLDSYDEVNELVSLAGGGRSAVSPVDDAFDSGGLSKKQKRLLGSLRSLAGQQVEQLVLKAGVGCRAEGIRVVSLAEAMGLRPAEDKGEG